MIACEAARYLIICLINYLLDHYNQFPGSRDPATTVGSHCTEFPGDVRVVTSVNDTGVLRDHSDLMTWVWTYSRGVH